MNRFILTASALLVAASFAPADLLPPGTKNIPINHTFETSTDYPEWAFYIIEGSGGVRSARFDAKTPIVIKGSSGVGNGPIRRPDEKLRTIPYRAAALVAVPASAAKNYKTEKEFHAAIEDGKVSGTHAVNGHFFDHENAKATDPRKSIERRYRITKIDAKSGVTLEPMKSDREPGPDEETAAASHPESFPWIAAGLGTAALVSFAGLLIVGRFRRGRNAECET